MPNDSEFVEREFSGGFGELGDLPEDLRGMGISEGSEGSYTAAFERDMYATVGGAVRPFMEPIPSGLTNQINWAAINYLPRFNFESFRSQRFYAAGSALLPPNPSVYVDLLINPASITPSSPVRFSSGVLSVPVGFAAVLTGFYQWIGDASAYEKPDGEPDDIFWRISAGATPIFNFGNFPFIISGPQNPAKLYAIANEATTIQVSAKNNLTPGSIYARSIPIKAGIVGHWFPIDELDDVFRNR